jgi:hypothetical protein
MSNTRTKKPGCQEPKNKGKRKLKTKKEYKKNKILKAIFDFLNR